MPGILQDKDLDALVGVSQNRNYNVLTISLAAAFTDQVYNLRGSFFSVLSITPGASVTVKFNSPSNPAITLDSQQRVFMPYTSVYITNAAAIAGATISLYSGLNTEYIPPYGINQISAYTLNIQPAAAVNVLVTATLISAADNNRRQMIVSNLDAVNTVYLGPVGVTTLTGLPLAALQERSFLSAPFFTGALYAIGTAAATSVQVWYLY